MKLKVKKESKIKEKREDILVTLVAFMFMVLICYFAINALGYKGLANGLLLIALVSFSVCLISLIRDKYVNNGFYFWRIIFANIAIFMMYVSGVLGVFRPIMKSVTIASLYSYIVIELVFIIIRVYWKNPIYIKNLKKNDVTKYAKIDIFISVVLIEMIICIAKYFDINGFSSIYSARLVLLAIICPSVSIIGAILCVHSFARYKHVISK